MRRHGWVWTGALMAGGLALALFVAGCGPSGGGPSGGGAAGIRITAVAAPAATTVGQTWSINVGVTGEAGQTLTWSITSGGGTFRPASGSIELTEATGQITSTYTAPSSAGTYTHTVSVTDGSATVDTSFTVVVSAAPPRILGVTPPAGLEPSGTGTVLIEVGGTSGETLTWALSEGDGSDGSFDATSGTLTLSDTTGQIRRTYTAPASPGSYPRTLTVTGTGGSASIAITLVVSTIPAPQIVGVSLPSGLQVGQSADVTFTLSGTVGDALTWSLTSGGGTFDAESGSLTLTSTSGEITATYTAPADVGIYTRTLAVTGAGGTTEMTFTLVVEAGAPQVTHVSIPSGLLPRDNGDVVVDVAGISGETLSWFVTGSGGDFSSATGELTLSGTAGQFTATFSSPVSGSFHYTVTVVGTGGEVVQSVDLVVGTGAAARVSGVTTPVTMDPGQSGPVQISVLGNDGQVIDWTLTSAGGTFEPSSGQLTLSGTTATIDTVYTAPAFTGSYNHTITLTTGDDIGSGTFTTVVAITEVAPQIVTIVAPSPMYVTTTNTVSVGVQGGSGDVLAWSFTAPGDGGTFDPASGTVTLTGTSGQVVTHYTAPATGGLRTFSVRVENAFNTAVSQTFDIEVVQPTSSTPPTSVRFAPQIRSVSGRREGPDVIWQAEVADDGPADALRYQWSFSGGLSFADATSNPATMQGYTPDAAGELTLTVTDGSGTGQSSTLSFALGLNQFPNVPPPAIAVSEELPAQWSLIAAGGQHSHAVALDHRLWNWGENGQGQLATGDAFSRAGPTRFVSTAAGWARLSASDHVLAIRSNGTLWAWGDNGYGQVGTGDVNAKAFAVQIGTDRDWSAVAAGYRFSLALKSDGSLWSWGYNVQGQLGLGDTSQRRRPTQVPGPANWMAISAGTYHVLALRSDGTLWAWGDNAYGQLGDGTTADRTFPVQVGSLTTWTRIFAGAYHSLGLAGGVLHSWGTGASGRLGRIVDTDHPANLPEPVDATTSDWRQAALGSTFTLAVKNDGTLWAWGSSSDGALGLGTSTQFNVPQQVGTDVDWAAVATGDRHTLALKTDGSLWSWGDNTYGQLGDGTTTDRAAPAPVLAPMGVGLLNANFDSGTLQGWTTNGSWGVTNVSYTSPSYSVTDSPDGSYANSSDSSLLSPFFDGSEAPSLVLRFWHHCATESCCDVAHVEVSSDGGSTYNEVASYSGTLATFTRVSIDLSSYRSSAMRIRFRLTTDSSVPGDGWYIDDIQVGP